MRQFKKIKIPIDIYGIGVHILIGGDIERVRKFIKEVGGFDFNDEDWKYTANHYYVEGKWPIIQMKKYSDSSLIHELFHSVYRISKYIGLKLSDDSQESYAYLLNYLFEETKKKLKK